MADGKRVCVIGAGPCGMSFLCHVRRLRKAGKLCPDVVCYEKQFNWGGMWNYTWRIGTDEYGEPCHGSMYSDLWSNGPKECIEYPDYTFDEHFGKAIPSFPPRDVLLDYLQGRWRKEDTRNYIRFSTIVKDVTYNSGSDDFTVVAKDLPNDHTLPPETFSHVIVASGHFSVPSVPTFDGIDRFPGRVLHSHDFRGAKQFQGQRILIVGAGLSAEDLALQCTKVGSVKVICCWRTKPIGFVWPKGIEERPVLTKIDGNTVHFKDGSTAEVDAIILCIGYVYHFPFLPDSLRLKTPLMLYPTGLYKGTIWLGGGNTKLMYMGMQYQHYTFTMFDIQAEWACAVINGIVLLPDKVEMEADIEKWLKAQKTIKVRKDRIAFQTEFVNDLSKAVGCKYDLDVSALFNKLSETKTTDVATYRDVVYTSVFTGSRSIQHHTPWMEACDDSLETFVNQTPNKSDPTQ